MVPLVAEHPVHRRVVTDHDRVVQVGFRGRDAKLDQSDFRVLDPGRTPGAAGGPLVEDQAVDELRVVDGAAELGDDADVAEVDCLGALRVDDWWWF